MKILSYDRIPKPITPAVAIPPATFIVEVKLSAKFSKPSKIKINISVYGYRQYITWAQIPSLKFYLKCII